jgi:DNA replication protein DnaC
MTYENKCNLASFCKVAGDERYCGQHCFAYTRMHGEKGNGGLVGVSNIPKKYLNSFIENLPFAKENPEAFEDITRYAKNVVKNVDNGIGLYLFGVPSKENPKGTGNGKTTAATALGNEYLKQRARLEMKKERKIDVEPVFFIKMAKFQNKYNEQFSGSQSTREAAGDEFARLKKKMTTVPLLIWDDIGLRGADKFANVVYEIIDERDTKELTTFFTSNSPIDSLSEMYNEQVASRIEGMTHLIPFFGTDKRKKQF